jgi:hypothetical protein
LLLPRGEALEIAELPETAQVQFNNARQTPEELLEDWVDHVFSLATRALRELPEKHMYHQVLTNFTIQAPAQLVPAFPFCPFAHFCITGKLRIEGFPV